MKDNDDRLRRFKIDLIGSSQKESENEWNTLFKDDENHVSRIFPGRSMNNKQNNINKFIYGTFGRYF